MNKDQQHPPSSLLFFFLLGLVMASGNSSFGPSRKDDLLGITNSLNS
jgi:hypothetical protein